LVSFAAPGAGAMLIAEMKGCSALATLEGLSKALSRVPQETRKRLTYGIGQGDRTSCGTS